MTENFKSGVNFELLSLLCLQLEHSMSGFDALRLQNESSTRSLAGVPAFVSWSVLTLKI